MNALLIAVAALLEKLELSADPVSQCPEAEAVRVAFNAAWGQEWYSVLADQRDTGEYP